MVVGDNFIKLKWLCLYLAKGRLRYLDLYKLYFDGSLDGFPVASICLDDPLVLLDIKHPKACKRRPSEIAKSCDLLADESCYALLKLVEERIAAAGCPWPAEPLVYVTTELDAQFQPVKVMALKYQDAVALFGSHAASLRLPIAPKINDPTGTLRLKFTAHAADRRDGGYRVIKRHDRPGFRSNFITI